MSTTHVNFRPFIHISVCEQEREEYEQRMLTLKEEMVKREQEVEKEKVSRHFVCVLLTHLNVVQSVNF